jgi:acid stress-induced BolA-like protein IbaG/YrbA
VSGGCGAQFSLLVVSAAFESASRVQQQRMVNEALEPHVSNVHSITMTTLTPAQWKARREQQTAQPN